jgi:predicted nucleic acid-binding Zn finger protein
MKDGRMYAELLANHKSYDQLSKTVLMQLKKGQNVWVRLVKNSSYSVYGGGKYTTFAGYIISY